jgi:Phasin protein
MRDHSFDLNAWLETYKSTFSSLSKVQQDSLKMLERFARFNYAVAGDVLEAGIEQAKVTLGGRPVLGTQAIAELVQKQADLGTQLSEKLQARAREFSALAAEVQQNVGAFAQQAAARTRKAA